MFGNNLFESPSSETLESAVKIARAAEIGKFEEAQAEGFEASIRRSAEHTGMTVEELDALGAPRTWLGRTVERLQDWWWDTVKAPKHSAADVLEAALAFPVPLLQTLPVQDTPYEYDEVEALMAKAQAEIVRVISAQTGWAPLAIPDFSRQPDEYGEYDDSEDMDMIELVVAAWQHPSSPARLLLVNGLDEDPKIMGYSTGLAYLTGDLADRFDAYLR